MHLCAAHTWEADLIQGCVFQQRAGQVLRNFKIDVKGWKEAERQGEMKETKNIHSCIILDTNGMLLDLDI